MTHSRCCLWTSPENRFDANNGGDIVSMDLSTALCLEALAKALLETARAVGAVHIEAVATKTEGMTQEQLMERIEISSKAISQMVGAISTAAETIKGEIDGRR